MGFRLQAPPKAAPQTSDLEGQCLKVAVLLSEPTPRKALTASRILVDILAELDEKFDIEY